jgi:aspartyl-tRNA(Asn)/glutamyl-tRNA(Gln) amidotransferase subunit B
MRVEVNISVSNTDTFGTKVEVKNINSFRSAEKAIEYEFKRQVDLILKGEKVIQETRGFDENKNRTFSQRSKEDSHDYRYFPDPDIPKFQINKLFSELEIPETPGQKRLRFAKIFGIKSEDIEFFINNQELSDLFEDAGKLFTGDLQYIKILSNYITSDLSGLIKKAGQDFGNINASGMYKLVDLIRQNKISSRGAKDILKIMFENGGDPFDIANSNNLILNTDENAVKEVIDGVLSENESIVKDYKSGKENALQFLIGQSMKKLKGSGNPQTIKDIILSKIS